MSPREDYGKGYGNFGKVIEKLFRMNRTAKIWLGMLTVTTALLLIGFLIVWKQHKENMRRLQRDPFYEPAK